MAPTRKSGPAKRGRPNKSAAEPTAKTRNREPQQRVARETTASKARKRSSHTGSETARVTKPSAQAAPARGRKRKANAAEPDDHDEIAAPLTPNPPKYLQLAPKTRRIPKETIDKWPVISSPVLDQVSAVLKRAKDIIACTRRDPKKQDEAVETLNAIIPQMERYFATTKIPPQTKPYHFDLEHLTSLNERVYAELTTARHRNQMLEEQIEHATAKLKGEAKLMEGTKENAQQWRRLWKSQEKKQLHPLLQQPEDGAVVDDKPDDIGLRKRVPSDASMLEAPDAELAPLLERLRRNLETMQGNHAQVDGIDEAVRAARVALDDVLFKHTSAQQYDAL